MCTLQRTNRIIIRDTNLCRTQTAEPSTGQSFLLLLRISAAPMFLCQWTWCRSYQSANQTTAQTGSITLWFWIPVNPIFCFCSDSLSHWMIHSTYLFNENSEESSRSIIFLHLQNKNASCTLKIHVKIFTKETSLQLRQWWHKIIDGR